MQNCSQASRLPGLSGINARRSGTEFTQPRRKDLITGATELRDNHFLPVHLKAENMKRYFDFWDVTLFLEDHITRRQKPVYFIKKETIKT